MCTVWVLLLLGCCGWLGFLWIVILLLFDVACYWCLLGLLIWVYLGWLIVCCWCATTFVVCRSCMRVLGIVCCWWYLFVMRGILRTQTLCLKFSLRIVFGVWLFMQATSWLVVVCFVGQFCVAFKVCIKTDYCDCL